MEDVASIDIQTRTKILTEIYLLIQIQKYAEETAIDIAGNRQGNFSPSVCAFG